MFLALLPGMMMAQRIQQKLGRGVVAVSRDGGNTVFISWRQLTNDPDSCTYNVYKRAKGTTDYTKLNASPLSLTNMTISGTQIPASTELAVTTLKDGTESDKSVPFLYRKLTYPNAYVDINFDETVLKNEGYHTKYVWPADFDGDGEFTDFVVDRLGTGAYSEETDSTGNDADTTVTTQGTDHKIQAYTIDGKLLWTVALGPNVNICAGQNDMVTVYDIDCDGKSDVIIKSSDGTRFWDSTNNTWGTYVFGGTDPDTDKDGIVDYAVSTNTKRNPPFYISVIDGLTGAEKVSAELDYTQVHDGEDQYTRDNRSDYMNNKGYYQMGGHFGITYDGVHPMLMMKCLDRDVTNQRHHDYVFAFGYDWVNGKATNFHHSYTWSRNDKSPWPAEFHGNRVCDVDGDGVDEIIPGAFAVNSVKGMVSSAGVGHGDRFTVSDIDPTRPGLEEYCIQQSNLLGQLIYDAATGEHIKEWYLPTAFDVSRGQCQDVDSTRLGMENYSFVSDYIYDCKGKKTDTARPYPNEGFWWDGDLMREALASNGGSGTNTNMIVQKVPGSSRLAEFSKESSWVCHGQTGTRPGFFGDMMGDWREEVVLMKTTNGTAYGIEAYSTNIPTNYKMVTLQEDPHYRLDCTTRGYYQSPNTDFYLGTGMKKAPVFPCVETDVRWKSGSDWNTSSTNFTTYDQTTTKAYTSGQSVLFDISGANSAAINISGALTPKALYLMNPKGHDYQFTGTGSLSGTMTLTKGMQGTAIFNTPFDFTGKTVISEGTLAVNSTIAGPVYLMSRGTLAGNPILNGNIYFEGALDYTGCRLSPGTADSKYGVITVNHDLTLPGDVYVETDINTSNSKIDQLVVKGNLTLKGTTTFTIDADVTQLPAGTYTLATCTGTLTANAADIVIKNADGVPYTVQVGEHDIKLLVDVQRAASTGVTWKGSTSGNWDYLSKNFQLNQADSYFVTGDEVTFDDQATNYNLTLSGKVIPAKVTFNNTNKYTLQGDGNISGTCDLIKNGTGELRIAMENNDYTGKTIINGGKLTIVSIVDSLRASSIGAADGQAGNLQINGATLSLDVDNTASNRIITVADTATIDIPTAGTSFTANNQVQGDGYLVKDGLGQFNFSYSGLNNFKGLIVRGGTVAQGRWNSTFCKTGGPVSMEGGIIALAANSSMSTTPNYNYVTTIKEGTENTLKGSFRSNFNGTLLGKGTLTFVSGGIRCYLNADCSQFEGLLKSSGSEFLINSGASDMSKLTLQPLAANAVTPSASELKIGNLISEATDCVVKGTTCSIGYNNEDGTYAGTLSCTNLNKYGVGTWQLNSTGNTCNINVNNGTLKIRNFSGVTTTKSMVVRSGATLCGRGSTQSILLYKGATIAAGINESSVGTITTTGNFIGYGGATLQVKAFGTSNDKYAVGGTFRLSGDTIRIVPQAGSSYVSGDEMTIFNVTGTFNAQSKWVIDGGGYEWDDTQLISAGKLICKGLTTGINQIDANQEKLVDVITTDGVMLKHQVPASAALKDLSRGIYIVGGKRVMK